MKPELRAEAERQPAGIIEEKPRTARRGTSSRQTGEKDRGGDGAEWDRVMPDHFALEDIWINIDEVDPRTVLPSPMWVRGSPADPVESRYYDAIQRLKESGDYKIYSVLAKSDRASESV